MLATVMTGVEGARWQDDDQLHLALRYIGEVDGRTASDVCATLARIAATAPTVAIAGVGRFEKRGRTDTLWAAAAPRAPLTALFHKVDRACVAAGLPPETRAYVPHLTLARLSRRGHDEQAIGRWIAHHAMLSSAPVVLPHLVLYESHLAADGATYEAIMRWPLGTAAPANGSHP